MAFKPYSPGTGVDHSEIVEVVLENSSTFDVGDLVQSSSTGFLEPATAGNAVLGVIVGFVGANDTNLAADAYAPGSATRTSVVSVTAASDNQTVAQKKALVETSKKKKWSANVSGTIGTTAASGKIGAGIDVNSAGGDPGQLLETTATRTRSTITNCFVWGTDPADSSRLLVSISASECEGKAG